MSANPLPEPRLSPPDPIPNPQVARPDYECATPRERKAVAEETIIALTECSLALRFLDLSDPEDMDNFIGVDGRNREFNCFDAIERIKKLVQEYLKDKVEPWDENA